MGLSQSQSSNKMVAKNNHPNNLLKSPVHLTLGNILKLKQPNDLVFITEPQENPWIHLDLELERFIDSVTITMKPKNLTDLYIFIGYEVPNVTNYNVLPLNINKFCGHIVLEETAENYVDWIKYKIDCSETILGTQMTIQLLSFHQVELNVLEVFYEPNPGKNFEVNLKNNTLLLF